MNPAQRLIQGLRSLRPRWAWILLALGLVWLVTPLSCGVSVGGCLAMVLAWCFWIAACVLSFFGLRWLWRRALFRVSRRLWLILSLVSVLPAIGMTILVVVVGWMTLGGQANRLMLGEIQAMQSALKTAADDGRDAVALRSLRHLGRPSLQIVPRLPDRMSEDFLGFAYDGAAKGTDGELTLRAVSPAEHGSYRVLSLTLDRLQERSQAMWGGRTHYRLDLATPLRRKKSEDRGTPPPPAGEARTWTFGKPMQGSFLFKSFRLPDMEWNVVDWATGQRYRFKATIETNLAELFAGYGMGERLKGIATDRAIVQLLPVAGLLFLLALVQTAALVLGFILTSNVGQAIHGLYLGVIRLTRGDFRARIKPQGHDQVAQLSVAFNGLAAQLERAEAERSERLRLEEELRVAREVQMRLLPDLSHLNPAIRATILPAKEVAGDYFDVLKIGEHRFAFLIADVSGKGTSAAFYAAETKGVLAALDKNALGPREVLGQLNAIWCQNNPRTLFMTATYGWIDTESGAFAFVRAGHPPAFLRRASGEVLELKPKGLGIGLTAHGFEQALDVAEGTLEAGDALIFYTDGLSEALNPEDALFGEARLADLLAEDLVDLPTQILAAVETFVEGRPLEDDLTLLVIQK